jgi:hypothetical protein
MSTTTLKHIRAERRELTPSGQPRARISTDELDSQRDRVLQAGLTFRDPMRVLFGHDAKSLPVGLVTAIQPGPRYTDASWRWFLGDPFVDRVRNIYEQGGLDASIGMVVAEAERNADGGHDITQATVVEFSLTPCPANAGAVALAKDLGMVAAPGRDPVAREHLAAAKSWLAPSPVWQGASNTVLVLRDPERGKPQCPGPGQNGKCEWRPNLPIEDCPAARCPIRGENVSAGIVLTDPHRLDARLRGSDRVAFREEDFRDAFARVVGEALQEPLRSARRRLTGKID